MNLYSLATNNDRKSAHVEREAAQSVRQGDVHPNAQTDDARPQHKTLNLCVEPCS